VDTSGGLSHVVAEVDPSGAVSVLYVRAGDLLLEEVRGGVVKMYEADGLGSVRGLLDASGAKTDTYSYEAFGSTLSSTGSDANPYRFAGERLVDSVGFYQNRARWLDTRTGGFVSVDRSKGMEGRPITKIPYGYAEASPLSKLDPSGNDADLSSIMGATVVSGILSTMAGCQPNTALQSGLGTRLRPPTGEELIRNSSEVRVALQRAWEESLPDDPVLRHEEGGWIYIHPDTRTIVTVREWRRENRPWRNVIDLKYPPILMSFYIVADFHTHPFPPPATQGPSDDLDVPFEHATGVPGLIRAREKTYPGTIERRLNYNGNFGYPNKDGGRW